jgi:hypothetical protein
MRKNNKDSWGSLNIEAVIEVDGTKYEVSATSYIQVSVDNDFGADADGNRGWPETFVDDAKLEVHSINVVGSKENIKDKLDADTMYAIDAELESIEEKKNIDDYYFNVEEPDYDYVEAY